MVGSGNIFDSHYIPDSFFGGGAAPANTERYLSKGLMNMKKSKQVTKELHNPFEDSLKQSLEPVANNNVRFHSSQRYVDVEDQIKSLDSEEQVSAGAKPLFASSLSSNNLAKRNL